MDVGNRIKTLRLKKGYSQNMLADFAGVSQTHLRRVELGQADVTVGHLKLICDALGVSLAQFFEADIAGDEVVSVVSALTPNQKLCIRNLIESFK